MSSKMSLKVSTYLLQEIIILVQETWFNISEKKVLEPTNSNENVLKVPTSRHPWYQKKI